MKLLCREDHDNEDRCPPHVFVGAYESDGGTGVIYCEHCGDVRSLTPTSLVAANEAARQIAADIENGIRRQQ
jgi:GAF domain-containing protein